MNFDDLPDDEKHYPPHPLDTIIPEEIPISLLKVAIFLTANEPCPIKPITSSENLRGIIFHLLDQLHENYDFMTDAEYTLYQELFKRKKQEDEYYQLGRHA